MNRLWEYYCIQMTRGTNLMQQLGFILYKESTRCNFGSILLKPSRCVSIKLVYIFTSYTTINIIIHTINCYKFNGIFYMFQSPLRPSSGQLLQIVRLQCAYNMGSHNVYIIFYTYGLKSLLKVFTVR